MFKNRKVIIFDWDGTLVDSIGMWNNTDEILVRKLAGDDNILVDNIGKIRGEILASSNSKDIYLEYCDYLGKKYNSSLSKEEILSLRRQISDEYVKTQIDYKPNADTLLHLLKHKGYTLALATTTTNVQLNAYRNDNLNIKRKANIDDIFDVVLSKDDVSEKKPNPEVHNKILKILNVNKDECLIIEDSLIGVQAAVNAGIDVAVIYDKYSDDNREQINKLSQYQFNNFDEIIKTLD